MSEFVKYLDLPSLPLWAVKVARHTILSRDNSSPSQYEDPLIKNCLPAETVIIQDKEIQYGEFYSVNSPSLIQNWQIKNFPIHRILNIILTTKGNLWPHQDYMAEWSLNYFIDTGGPAVETYWSQEEGSPLIPPWKPLLHWRYNQNLREVHHEIIPANQWVLFPVNIVHGTRNQISDRIGLAVKITEQEAQNLIKKYGKK